MTVVERTQQLRKTFPLEPAPGGGGRGKKSKRAKVPMVASTPVSETVDLTAEGEGLLWLPTSMSPPDCPGGPQDEDGCDSTVQFCLMNVREYQETPWQFPMAAMLQMRSACRKPENARAFRLSALRVRHGMDQSWF